MNTKTFRFKSMLGLLLVLVLFLGMSEVFAQNAESGNCTQSVKNSLDLLFHLQSLFSWVWLILANLVGKLMTNAFVYGEFLNLDTFLWQLWQISRNIANLAIGGYFLYAILKFMLSPSDKDTNPKNLVKDMLFAGVLVQASWFIVMVIVDISSILFATVSAIPSQLIAEDTYLEKSLTKTLEGDKNSSATKTNNDIISYWNRNIVKLSIGYEEVSKAKKAHNSEKGFVAYKNDLAIEVVDRDPSSPALTKAEMFDNLLPKHNSLSGPLMYLGLSMFKTFEFVNPSSYQGVNCNDTMMKDVIVYLLRRGLIILYTLSLFVLAVILIGRVAYLWIFIAISPIVFLLKFFKVIKAPGKELFWDLEKMISLIFQPVRFALFISLMMVVLITLSGLFQSGSEKNLGDGFRIMSTENSSQLDAGNLITVGLRNTALTFEHLFLGAISLLCMWELVKMAATTKTGITWLDNLMESTTKFAEQAITTTPIIPTPVGKVWLSAFYETERGKGLFGQMKDKQDQKISQRLDKQNNAVLEFFGRGAGNAGLSEVNKTSLQQIASRNTPTAFADYIEEVKKIRKERSIWYRDIADTLYTAVQPNRINWNNVSADMKNLFSQVQNFKTPDEAKSYFENNLDHFKILYKEVFGDAPNITSVKDLRSPTHSQYRLPALEQKSQ